MVTTATIYYENGDVYIGEVCRGKRHGTGTLSFEEGSGIYEGDWKDGKRCGTGHQVSKAGKYSGQFLEYVLFP